MQLTHLFSTVANTVTFSDLEIAAYRWPAL